MIEISAKNYFTKIALPISVMALLCATGSTANSSGNDHYKNFESLSKVEVLNSDYTVRVQDRKSEFTIIGIHGGRIESGTSEIVSAIAGNELSAYLFEGIRLQDNRRLHITSSSFDEPQALNLMKDSMAAVSIHGFKEDARRVVCVGGMNSSLASKLVSVLGKTDSWSVESPCMKFPGNTKDNIVNRAKCHGVQLEISSSLRKNLVEDPVLLKSFSESIRKVVLEEERILKMNKHNESKAATACNLL